MSGRRKNKPSSKPANREKRAKHFTSIIIPTVHDTAMTAECVRAIKQHTQHQSYEIIVVDDGSGPEIRAQLAEFGEELGFKLLLNPDNAGFSATCNHGLRAARGDRIVLMNNDVIVHDGWLTAMLKCADRDEKIGLVGARLLYPDGTLQHAGVYFDPRIETAFDHRWRHGKANSYEVLQDADVVAVTFALVLITRAAYEGIGPMDQDLFVSLEDVDYCLRARDAGYRVVYCSRAVATHFEGATRGKFFFDMDPLWVARQMETLDLFFEKWATSGICERIQGLAGFDQFCERWVADGGLRSG